jgi:hypothetical protein
VGKKIPMATFVHLTVKFTLEKSRAELINLDKVVRIIDAPNGKGCTLYLGVDGPEIRVAESSAEILQKLASK